MQYTVSLGDIAPSIGLYDTMGSEHSPWTYSPGDIPPDIPFTTISSLFTWRRTIPPSAIRDLPLTCTKLVEVDRLRSEVRLRSV